MVLTGTPASTTSTRTTLFQSTGLHNKAPTATTSIKNEVVESDDVSQKKKRMTWQQRATCIH